MRPVLGPFVHGAALAWALARAAVLNVTTHWALAAFSLVSAFGVWFAIQDVENPRVEGLVPVSDAGQGVRVEALNIPDGYIVIDPQPVRVRVQARKDEIPQLRAGDFKATITVENIQPGSPASLPVKVEARRSGVTVLGVDPPSVEVTLVQSVTKEFRVEVNELGRLPEGYVETDLPAVDPAFVKVTGRAELVDTVKVVSVDVNVSGARDATTVLEGDVVARTASGNPVAVSLSQARVKVTFKLEQTFTQRTLPLTPLIVGSPAPGYLVGNITIEPPVVVATGVKAVVDGLKQLNVEKIDITAATKTIIQTRQIERPPNILTDRQTVVVRVELRPIDCTGAGSADAPLCGSATMVVSPVFQNLPPGTTLDLGPYVVQVHLSGPLVQITALKPSDFRAVVSLAGGAPGTLTFPVTVTAPPGIKVDGADPVVVTLKPVGTP